MKNILWQSLKRVPHEMNKCGWWMFAVFVLWYRFAVPDTDVLVTFVAWCIGSFGTQYVIEIAKAWKMRRTINKLADDIATQIENDPILTRRFAQMQYRSRSPNTHTP